MHSEYLSLGVLKGGFCNKPYAVHSVTAGKICYDGLKAGKLLYIFIVYTVLFTFLIPKDVGNRLVFLSTTEAEHLVDAEEFGKASCRKALYQVKREEYKADSSFGSTLQPHCNNGTQIAVKGYKSVSINKYCIADLFKKSGVLINDIAIDKITRGSDQNVCLIKTLVYGVNSPSSRGTASRHFHQSVADVRSERFLLLGIGNDEYLSFTRKKSDIRISDKVLAKLRIEGCGKIHVRIVINSIETFHIALNYVSRLHLHSASDIFQSACICNACAFILGNLRGNCLGVISQGMICIKSLFKLCQQRAYSSLALAVFLLFLFESDILLKLRLLCLCIEDVAYLLKEDYGDHGIYIPISELENIDKQIVYDPREREENRYQHYKEEEQVYKLYQPDKELKDHSDSKDPALRIFEFIAFKEDGKEAAHKSAVFLLFLLFLALLGIIFLVFFYQRMNKDRHAAAFTKLFLLTFLLWIIGSLVLGFGSFLFIFSRLLILLFTLSDTVNIVYYDLFQKRLENDIRINYQKVNYKKLYGKEDVIHLRIDTVYRIGDKLAQKRYGVQQRSKRIKYFEQEYDNYKFDNRKDQKEDILSVMRRLILKRGRYEQLAQFTLHGNERITQQQQNYKRYNDFYSCNHFSSRPFFENIFSIVSIEKIW